MALQSALSRLRNAAASQSTSSSEKIPKTGPADCSGLLSTSGVFTLEETDKDLFNFSDDDFLQDGGLFSPPPTPASENAAPERRDDVDRASKTKTPAPQNPNDLERRVQGTKRWSQASGHQLTQPNSIPTFNAQMEAESSSQICENSNSNTSLSNTSSSVKAAQKCSPSTSSLERLKSFAFVRAHNTNRGRRPDVDSTLLPPTKRKTVCADELTDTGGNEPIVSLSTEQGKFHSQGNDPQMSGCAVAKEIGKSHSDVASGNQPTRLTTSTNDRNCPDKFEFDFDAFLSDLDKNNDLSGSDPSRNLMTTEATTPSPSPFKPPTYNPRKGTLAPSRISDTHHSMCSQTNKLTNSSQTFQTPQKLPRSSFSQPTSRGFLATPATPQTTRTLTSVSTPGSSVVFSTPKGRPTPQELGTPSLTTPTWRTPILVYRPSRRKFPGPAGLLPPLAPGQSLDGICIPPPSTPTPASTPRVQRIAAVSSDFPSSSQDGGTDPHDFTQGPWVDMLEDLDMNDVHSSTLLQYDISRAIKQASHRRLRNGKVTHLRVMLKNLVPAGKNASAVLKDPTGEILCTLHTKVLEDHQKDLQPGAVLILRQVSVFSPTPRKHYLNITPDNIVRIYPLHLESTTRKPLILSEIEKKYSESCESTPGSHQQRTIVTESAHNSRLNSPMVTRKERMSASQQKQSSESEFQRWPPSTAPNDSSTEGSSSDCFDHDWTSFDDFPEVDVETAFQRTNVQPLPNPPQQVSQAPVESMFSKQLCEDEFDNLFNDISDNSFSF